MSKRSKKTEEAKREAAEKEAARLARKEKRKALKHDYRKRQKSTSIYFLLWTVFSALSLLIVLVIGLTQSFFVRETYKSEAAKELSEKGGEIETLVLGPVPEEFGGNRGLLIEYVSAQQKVDIYILNEEGVVLYPKKLQPFDFTEKIAALKEELEKEGERKVVYEGNEEYVYGAKVSLYGNENTYLYVSKPLDLLETATKQFSVRMVLVATLVLVLSFAVSSGVSGWLTRPLTEMTKKARLLANGDFAIDFHGSDYGEEMVELADTLNYARDELSKADTMQKELIANVSHDFKTPLTMIKAYASMIMEISGEIPEKRNKHAQVIIDEADRLASLVGDVLDLSKIQSGINALELRNLDMSAYLFEILDRFDYLRETKGYFFVLDIEDGLYSRVDEVKIGQAIYNLIGNAVNYTGEDKKVFVRLKRIEEGVFRFSVTDTGSGIKAEEISTIWDRYYRSAETHKRPVQGTGLGLSIVKAVLQKHGFYFGVESEEGKGSTFFVDFPLVTTEEKK